MTHHFECSAEGWQHHESEGWGRCQRFIEVLDDQRASRQIDVYTGGRVLLYDRVRCTDRFGMLIGLRFSRKDKWKTFFSDVREISEPEFENAWRRFAAVADRPQGQADDATAP